MTKAVCLLEWAAACGFFLLGGFVPARAAGSVANLPSPAQIRVQKVVRLTSDGGGYARPVWSPDGRMIAYGRPGMAGLEVIRRDGSGRQVLSTEPGAGYKFAWSPDSLEIAFRVMQEGANAALYVIKSVDIATGKTRVLSQPKPDVQPPAWSAAREGKRVSFVAGGKRVNSRWSPSGGQPQAGSRPPADALLYLREGNIWTCNADGSESKPLTHGGGLDPVPSPDGSQIVYSQVDTLMLMNADGAKSRPLAQGHHPSWSPDGRLLVYEVNRDDGHRIVGADLWLIKADGTEPTQLTRTPDLMEVEPCWSPDGRHIVFRTEDSGQIYLLTLDW